MKNKCRLRFPPSPARKRCHCSCFRCLSLSCMAANPSFQNCFPGCFFCYFVASASYFWACGTLCCHCCIPSSLRRPWLASVPSSWMHFFYPPSQTHLFTLTRRGHIKIALVRVVSSGPALCWRQHGSFLTFRLVEGKPLTIMAPIMGRLTSYWHWKLFPNKDQA